MRFLRMAICGFALIAALCASAVLLATPAHSAATAQPHGLKLLINGKQLPITPFAGPDRYNPISASKLRVQAKWQGSLTGSGYKIEISTTEPTLKTWKSCSTGTSCLVAGRVPIVNGEQMSWTVRLMISKHHFVKIISGFMVCLARHTSPA
jgi:opacity protein-like surface antigen